MRYLLGNKACFAECYVIASDTVACIAEVSVIDKAMEIAASGNGDDGQIDMFSTMNEAGVIPVLNYPQIPEMSVRDKLFLEKEFLGVFASGHILSDYSEHVDLISPDKISDIREKCSADNFLSKDVFVICGTVTKRSVKETRKGDRMAFISIEDGSGEIEVILFSQIYTRSGYLINTDAPICITASVSSKDDELRLICNDIIVLIDNEHMENAISIPMPERKTDYHNRAGVPLYKSSMKSTPPVTGVKKQPKLYVKLNTSDEALYKRLLCYFEIFSGKIPVIIYDTTSASYAMNTGYFVSGSDMMINELKELLGNDSVVLK